MDPGSQGKPVRILIMPLFSPGPNTRSQRNHQPLVNAQEWAAELEQQIESFRQREAEQ